VEGEGSPAPAGEHTDHTAGGLARLERPPVSGGSAEQAVVVLVHGSMDRATSFRRVMRHLPEVTVVAYDRRGYGGSIGVDPSDDFALQADVVVGYGSEGAEHHRRCAPALASELPDGRLVEVPAAGHGVHLSHLEALAGLVGLAIAARQGRP
jgi:pimeloyl-ACP methyl ester carboxylesterase